METELQEGLLVGMGNPLLDISANVDKIFLERYGLEPNGAIMAEEKHMPLYQELMKCYDTEYIAGGSVQNSLRVAQWVLNKPKVCTYFGCVGLDEYANILKDKAIKDGVNVQYQVTRDAPTGTCAVLVNDNGMHRSLCANLAAAQLFKPEHLDKPESKYCIEEACFYYASGFFIAVSPESILKLAVHSEQNNGTFILNISAPFVVQFYKEPLDKIIPYADIIVGNDQEFGEFAKAFGMETTDFEEIGRRVVALPKNNKGRPRVVVLTQGPNPVLLFDGTKPVQHVPVPVLSPENIVDTNGAGDAFVGGFLSQLLQNKPLTTCVECGIYTAREVIQHSGCTFGEKCNFVPKTCECKIDDSDDK